MMLGYEKSWTVPWRERRLERTTCPGYNLDVSRRLLKRWTPVRGLN